MESKAQINTAAGDPEPPILHIGVNVVGYIVLIILGALAAIIVSRALKTKKEKAQELQRQQEQAEKEAQAAVLRAEREELERQQALEFSQALESIPAVEISVADTPVKKRNMYELDDVSFSNITKKTPRDKLGNFVAVDVETTGLSQVSDEIIEVAAIRFREFKPVEKFATLCAPKKGIDEAAARVNGITADMVEDKPLFGQIAPALQEFIGKDNVVGHNLDFDLRFLCKHGVDFTAEKHRYYDTLEIAQRTLKKVKKKYDRDLEAYVEDYFSDYDVDDYKLGTLCEYYKIPFFGSHRAIADCYVTGLLLERLAWDRE